MIGAKWLGVTLLALCTGGALAFRFERRVPFTPLAAESDSLRVRRGSVSVRLTLIGELRPTRSTTVTSSLGGDETTIVFLISDGAPVEEGDELVRFDRTPFEEALRLADVELARHESQLEVRRQALAFERAQATKVIDGGTFEVELARLEQLRFKEGEGPLELARLRSELAVAETELARNGRFVDELSPLLAKGFVQPTEIDQLTMRRDEAARVVELARQQAEAYEKHIFPSRAASLKVGYDRAVASLSQLRTTSAAKVAESEASFALAERDLAAARARLADVRSDLERTIVRAPTAGMLVLTEEFRNGQKRKPRVGDTVWKGQQLAFLPDLSEFVVEGRVREVDLHKIAPGVRGRASFDAYPELVLEAIVRGVGVLAERATTESGQKSFGVVVDLVGSDPRLRPGMTARIELDSGRVDDVLLLPVHALFENRSGAWCWIETETGLERRELQIGLRNNQVVEVRSGVAEGDAVSLDPPLSTEASFEAR